MIDCHELRARLERIATSYSERHPIRPDPVAVAGSERHEVWLDFDAARVAWRARLLLAWSEGPDSPLEERTQGGEELLEAHGDRPDTALDALVHAICDLEN